jgi:hypothetical protein
MRQPLARRPGDVEAVGLGPLLDPEVAHAIKQHFDHRQADHQQPHRAVGADIGKLPNHRLHGRTVVPIEHARK